MKAGHAVAHAPADEPIRYEYVSANEARKHVSTPAPLLASPEPRRRRLSVTPEVLNDESVAWLATVPEAFRPVELPRQFPRIVNRLCSYRKDPAQWDRYLSSLLIDSRDGSRAGFPPKVAAELAKLFSMHEKVTADQPWSTDSRDRR